jgi:hypothetical protein
MENLAFSHEKWPIFVLQVCFNVLVVVIRLQNPFDYYAFLVNFSRLSWLESGHLILFDKHDSPTCNSSFLFYKCVWVFLWFAIKPQKLLICYVFGGVSSKLSWLGIDMTITSRAFLGLALLMLLDMHDFNLVISHFSLANVYGGLWHK